MKVVFTLTNGVDPDEMPHYAASHLGLHYLPKYKFRGLQYTKGFILVRSYKVVLCVVDCSDASSEHPTHAGWDWCLESTDGFSHV